MMDNAIEPINPTLALARGAIEAPMHYLFEIQLMANQIVGKATAENGADSAWKVKFQHVRRYLVNYYKEHAVLPTGRHYLGMTRPYNFEVGMVDLGAVRQKIRTDGEEWNGTNQSPGVFEDVDDEAIYSGTVAGVREQAVGQEPNQVIFDLRQALARREKKA